MNASKPFPIILHVRVPSVLRGGDQQRYIERKLGDFGLRLRPPLTLADTGIPVGYALARFGAYGHGWHVVEARGEVDAHVTIIELHQHELVEDAMDEAVEDARRAKRAAEWAEMCRLVPGLGVVDDDDNITAGGPMPNPFLMGAVRLGIFFLTPFTLAARGINKIRRWYVREHG